MCAPCAQQDSDRTRARKARYVAAGLCAWCASPRGNDRQGNQSCGACAAKFRAKQKTRADGRKAAGKCVACGGKPRSGRTLCGPCAARATESQRGYFERRRAAGLCKLCGNAQPPERAGMSVCAPCVAKIAVYKRRSMEAA